MGGKKATWRKRAEESLEGENSREVDGEVEDR